MMFVPQEFSAYNVLNNAVCRLLQSPAIALAIARDCYILVVLFFIFYFFYFFSVHQIFVVLGPIFAKLCHTTRYVLK